MKKLLIGIAAVVLLWFGGVALYRGLASDETKIGWLFEEGVDAFNAGRVGACVDVFAPRYRDATSGVDRNLLRQALTVVLLRETRENRPWPWCIEIPVEDREVEVLDGEPRRASAVFSLSLRRTPREGETVDEQLWLVRVEAELSLGSEGWQFAGSKHESVSGERPR